ncbi:hypothetical protein HPP92_009762 [Vanilla planifolia]|uniref:Uncharacterized protein n=1 Tax=Vanilla planifolia TaxID=51239 RepID=A0A835RBK2_VANPL|nr:hypothetical protein HPP92_009973 [Vanilla planifolia]KAG0487667.1 hypothetical protein HPP92_009762 [Vanilla planifolia]
MRERKNLDKDSSGGGTAGEVSELALMNHFLKEGIPGDLSCASATEGNLRGAPRWDHRGKDEGDKDLNTAKRRPYLGYFRPSDMRGESPPD